jgi:hypothetical protein
MRDFLASLSFLNEAQILELVASWEARDVRAHEDAWTQVIACAAANRLTAEMARMPRGCRPSKACPRRRPERGRIDRCGDDGAV